MATNSVKQGSGKELKQIFGQLTAAISETLGSMVAREIAVRPREPEVVDADTFVAGLPRACAVARGALDQTFAGKTLLAIVEVPDAIALAGLLMMTPDDVIAQRRSQGELEGEDAEAFGQLGSVLFSGLGNVLRERVADTDVRYQDQVIVRAGAAVDATIGSGPLVVFGFRMKVGEYPESSGALVVDLATAEAWNKEPLDLGPADPGGPAFSAAPAGPRTDDDGLDGIPAAPIRGTLAAFVAQLEVLRTLRRSCRRVGLEVRRHGRGEIPNPAAHKHEIVLLDVPAGEDRRFDWCKRIKEICESTRVVVLIHQPSRQRVTQAFLARADVILGFPCDEMHLSQKLGALLASGTPDAPPAG